MVQYRRALMRRDISNSALATKWFMSCDAPLYSILTPGLLGMHTCSEHVCSGSNCRRAQHIASLPPAPVLTDMKGAAWAGYHGNRCTLHSVAAAVGFWCRTVFPEHWLDTIAVFNGMLSILFSQDPPPHSLCGMTALSCQRSPLFQDGSQPRGWRWMQPVAPHRARRCCIHGVMINGFVRVFCILTPCRENWCVPWFWSE